MYDTWKLRDGSRGISNLWWSKLVISFETSFVGVEWSASCRAKPGQDLKLLFLSDVSYVFNYVVETIKLQSARISCLSHLSRYSRKLETNFEDMFQHQCHFGGALNVLNPHQRPMSSCFSPPFVLTENPMSGECPHMISLTLLVIIQFYFMASLQIAIDFQKWLLQCLETLWDRAEY